MPQIQKEYEEYLRKHVAEHGVLAASADTEDTNSDDETPAPDAWWKFACARAREMLEEESDEVKKEVEASREKASNAKGLEKFLDEEGGDKDGAVPELAESARGIQT